MKVSTYRRPGLMNIVHNFRRFVGIGASDVLQGESLCPLVAALVSCRVQHRIVGYRLMLDCSIVAPLCLIRQAFQCSPSLVLNGSFG